MRRFNRPLITLPAYTLADVRTILDAPADRVVLGEPFCRRRLEQEWDRDSFLIAVNTLHASGKAAYITTLADVTSDEDVATNLRLLQMACDSQANGVVANEWGVLELAQEHGIDLPIMASDFIPSHSSLDMEWLIGEGVDEARLPEDMTYGEMADAVRNAAVSVELKVHGPVIVDLSWRCMYRSINSSVSCPGDCAATDGRYLLGPLDGGNRLFELGGKILLSHSDLCLVGQLPDVIGQLRVASVYIETRGRGGTYAADLACVYEEALHAACTGSRPFDPSTWMARARLAANRAICNGYFCGLSAGRRTAWPCQIDLGHRKPVH